MFGKVVPEDGGGHGEGPVAPGFAIGFVGFEEAGLTGSEGAWWGVCFEEVGEVGGCQVVQCLIGDEECFEVYPLFDRQPV